MGLFKNWKPKTVAGKILKGTTIGVLGVGALASGVGAIAGAVGGAGLFAGAAGAVGTVVKTAAKVGAGTKTVLSKISGSAVKLVTGQSKEERAIIQDVKKDAREIKDKYEFVEKLKKAGLSEAEAYAKAGLEYATGGDVKTEAGEGFLSKLRAGLKDSEPIAPGMKPGTDNKMLIYGGLGLLGLFVLPKLFKQ